MAELIIIVLVIALFIPASQSIRRLKLRGLIFIAILSALASCGRMLFAAVPSVQPASCIVMICGMIYGAGGGLLCGAVTALLSSLLTSVGPWTAWQALLWGLMGMTGAVVSGWRSVPLGLIGAAWGFVFGWVMNLWYFTMGAIPFTAAAFLAACAASFPFDLAHALTNWAILTFFGRYLTNLIKRLDSRAGKKV